MGVSPVVVAAGNDFSGRLANAAAGTSTYDRYTFYRMLDQLGTDSAPESGKLNLNYSNAVVSYNNNGVVTDIAIIPGAETNLVPWTALDFFTAAADRMLRTYTTNWLQPTRPIIWLTYYGYHATPTRLYIGPDGFGLTNFPYHVT